ncbi:uncharacterized protein MONBRDRAFT_32916 [Monosiga brevicollis MX1]|uniref:NACHT domain-containing protein n=1 Tax=Monosiga brevicollis TaxID=81824 RepID=A9V2I3_MONBE|nr:uncharacterized protein MONBRDRAFT_32916 [Monosiga brevicollis MX1]EDQ88261.1 predicted protein [Monosiga brevicollis MX1]|eukprot:XP_001746854.1 hypothetical protein [Monosiga brevicollis MX1]
MVMETLTGEQQAGAAEPPLGAETEPPVSTPTPQLGQVVRLFISSSFRDMRVERQILAHTILPKVRLECSRRGVIFLDIDLKWGIEQDTPHHEVIETCLRQVARSRPYILGMIAQRYGSVPSQVQLALNSLSDELSIAQDFADLSLTELELTVGFFNVPSTERRAVLLFRDPAYSREQAQQTTERDDFFDSDVGKQQSLESLERRLRDEASHHIRLGSDQSAQQDDLASCTALALDYQRPSDLTEHLADYLMAMIKRDYPLMEHANPIDQDNFEHRMYALTRDAVFAPLEDSAGLLETLDTRRRQPGVTIVHGHVGSGKSSLLAKCAVKWDSEPETAVLYHFTGKGGSSDSLSNFSRRLFHFVARRYHVKLDDLDFDLSLHAWHELLELALNDVPQSLKSPLVVLVDGADEFNKVKQLNDWLPSKKLLHMSIIVSVVTPLPNAEQIPEATWSSTKMPLMTRRDREQFAKAFLQNYGQTLPSHLMNQLIDSEGIQTPLHLRTLLNEFRLLASFDTLDKVFQTLIGLPDVESLFNQILIRWEQLPSPARLDMPLITWSDDDALQSFAAVFLIYIAVAENGLELEEILSIMHVPPTWYAKAMDNFGHISTVLAATSGRLYFAHQVFEAVVRRRYFSSDESTENHARQAICQFMEAKPLTRSCDELTHQYLHLDEEKAVRHLTRKDVLQHYFRSEAERINYIRLWQAIPVKPAISQLLKNLNSELAKVTIGENLLPIAYFMHQVGCMCLHQSQFPLAQRIFAAGLDLLCGLRPAQDLQIIAPEEQTDDLSPRTVKFNKAWQLKHDEVPPVPDFRAPQPEEVPNQFAMLLVMLHSLADVCDRKGENDLSTQILSREIELRRAYLSDEERRTNLELDAAYSLLAWTARPYKKRDHQKNPIVLPSIKDSFLVNYCAIFEGGPNDARLVPSHLVCVPELQDMFRLTDPREVVELLTSDRWQKLKENLEHAERNNSVPYRNRRSLSMLYSRLGAILGECDERDLIEQAEDHLKHSIEIARSCCGPLHPSVATSLMSLGMYYINRAKGIVRKRPSNAALPSSPSLTANQDQEQANALFRSALVVCEEAAEIRSNIAGPDSSVTITARYRVCEMKFALKQDVGALPKELEYIITRREALFGSKHAITKAAQGLLKNVTKSLKNQTAAGADGRSPSRKDSWRRSHQDKPGSREAQGHRASAPPSRSTSVASSASSDNWRDNPTRSSSTGHSKNRSVKNGRKKVVLNRTQSAPDTRNQARRSSQITLPEPPSAGSAPPD